MSQHCLFVYRRTPKLLTHRNSHQLVRRHTNRLRAASYHLMYLVSLLVYFNIHGELQCGDSLFRL